MTTYSICNQRTATTIGRFEADSAAEAIKAAGGGDDLVATALDSPPEDHQWSPEDIARMGEHKPFVFNTTRPVPEAPACPFKLPLSVGNSSGGVPDQIYDTTDQAVLILYAVDSRGTVDEARTMSWNQHGLVRGDYVVKAVNEHEGLVKRVAEMQLTLDAVQAALGDNFDEEAGHARSVLRLKTAFDAEAKLGETYKKLAISGELPEITYLTAKPVDRRKDRCELCTLAEPHHAPGCPNKVSMA